MKPKVKVGDVIYSLNIGSRAINKDQVLESMTVKKVTRKHFTLEGKNLIQVVFHVETWMQKKNGVPTHALYASENEWFEIVEAKAIIKIIKDRIALQYLCGLAITQLREIRNIITQ